MDLGGGGLLLLPLHTNPLETPRPTESGCVMVISDVSCLSHGDRFHHYLDSYGGTEPSTRLQAFDMAVQAADHEMLDEIHTMLRHLCGIVEETQPNEKGGDA